MDAKIKQIDIPFKKGDLITPDQAMRLAMDVAVMGAPYVASNPCVGCVVVDPEHRFLTYGFHKKYGFDHAEIDALKKLSESDIRGSTFYVTLEPCAHEGKTGSCAKKLATLPVKKVVYGLVDPNPLVHGEGAKILQNVGIEAVEYQGPLKSELSEVCEIFLKNFVEKKVFVAMKVATSLDGQMALKTGESRWITSEASREYVHELRSYYDAILVGRNTVETDDPSLNIRHPQIEKESKLIILDPSGTLLRQIEVGKVYKFLGAHKPENIFFAVRVPVESRYQQVTFADLQDLLSKLWDLKLKSLFIEGGAKAYSSFIEQQLVDRLYMFMAPSLIGAKTGLAWTSELGIQQLKDKVIFKDPKVRLFGSDIFISVKIK